MPDVADECIGMPDGGRDDGGGALGVGWGEVLLKSADVEREDNVVEDRGAFD